MTAGRAAGDGGPSFRRPVGESVSQTMTHDYKRNGTTTLFAALDVKTGEVIGECLPRHRAKEFIRFLKKINRAGKRGKTGGGMNLRFTGGHELDSFWECCEHGPSSSAGPVAYDRALEFGFSRRRRARLPCRVD